MQPAPVAKPASSTVLSDSVTARRKAAQEALARYRAMQKAALALKKEREEPEWFDTDEE